MSLAVVIGHGASPHGKGWGERIDAAAHVVRLHDCHWQDAPDYGERYDYGILPGPWFQRALKQVQVKPSKGWLCYRLSDQRNRRQPEGRALGLPVYAAGPEIAWIRTPLGDLPPTRGLAAAALAAFVFKPLRLVLVGFDSVYGEAVGEYAPGCGRAAPGVIGEATNRRHDYRAERKALDLFETFAGVRPENAAEAWR